MTLIDIAFWWKGRTNDYVEMHTQSMLSELYLLLLSLFLNSSVKLILDIVVFIALGFVAK